MNNIQRKKKPEPIVFCFERKAERLEREALVEVHVTCLEGRSCILADDDRWARPTSVCESSKVASSGFVATAYADVVQQLNAVSWVSPSIETLQTQRKTGKSRGFTEFTLTSDSLPGLKNADRVHYGIRVNGTPVYINSLPWEAYSMPFDAGKGVNILFGLENLDFAGQYQGYEHIEVVLGFTAQDRSVKNASFLLKYIALRDELNWETVRDHDIALRWKATYNAGQSEDVYQVFVFSDTNIKAAENLKRQIDRTNFSMNGETIVAIIRPELHISGQSGSVKNSNFGVVLGKRQPSGQIKFSFDDATSRELCKSTTQLAATLKREFNAPYRRSIASRKDSRQCQFL